MLSVSDVYGELLYFIRSGPRGGFFFLAYSAQMVFVLTLIPCTIETQVLKGAGILDNESASMSLI